MLAAYAESQGCEIETVKECVDRVIRLHATDDSTEESSPAYILYRYIVQEVYGHYVQTLPTKRVSFLDLPNLLVYQSPDFADALSTSTLSIFDLDHTLINPHNGKVFPDKNDPSDWEMWSGGSDRDPVSVQKRVLKKLRSLPAYIVISNQAIEADEVRLRDVFKQKMVTIAREIGKPCLWLVACGSKSFYRKPSTTIVDEFIWGICDKSSTSAITSITYVGDFAGRVASDGNKKDKGASDRQFLENLKIAYPEITCEFYTPEEYFLHEPPRKFKLCEYDTNLTVKTGKNKNKTSRDLGSWPTADEYYGQYFRVSKRSAKKPTLVLTVGYSGSGKSAFAQWLVATHSYISFSGDSLTPAKLVKAVKEAMEENRHIVVDNMSGTQSARAVLAKLISSSSAPYRLKFVVFTTSLEMSRHMNWVRAQYNHLRYPFPELVTDREVLKHLAPIPDVVNFTFRKQYQPPTLEELQEFDSSATADDLVEIPFQLYRVESPILLKLLQEYS